MHRTSTPIVFALLAAPALGQSLGSCGLTTKLVPQNDERHVGFSLDIDGARLVAGAPAIFGNPDNVQGRAAVFELGAGGWAQIGSVGGSLSGGPDDFGHAVSLSSDAFVVGVPDEANPIGNSGVAYVFRETSPGSWTEEARLTPSVLASNGQFGEDVAIDGDRLAVGSPATVGAVYVFENQPGGWIEVERLAATDGEGGDRFGGAIDLDGDRIVVANAFDNVGGSVDIGSVYVFDFDGTAWSQSQKITAPDAQSSDFFGRSIALDGDALAVGATGEDEAGPGKGAVYVFRRIGGLWTFEQKILSTVSEPFFGSHVDLAGDALIAAPGLSSPFEPTLYSRSGNLWTLRETFSVATGTFIASDVAISADRLAIGNSQDNQAGSNAGAVLLAELAPAPFVYCTAKVTSIGCIPAIDFSGTPSATNLTPFVLGASQVPNQKNGLLFYGLSGSAALPFLGGTLCAQPPLARTAIQISGGNPPPDDCSGSYAFDFGAHARANPNLGPESRVNAQYWFRDPANPDGTGAGLSDAVQFELCE